MLLAWDKAFAAASRRPRLAWSLAAAVVLAVAAMLAGYWLATSPTSPVAPRTQSTLRKLPALPADIEAHGAQSQSVLPPDIARARNEADPFAEGALHPARPFRFQGSDQDRLRAVECLATAALYEAGDDTVGQAAVAQVVLNRVRHPAFPGSVCGVVFQGSERSTGCQFTFTCDGSLRRTMSQAAWQRARTVATRAIAGWVDATVGLATHYHTDWVYPYWSPKLRKVAKVGTHLFFGWPGSWGKQGAFSRVYQGNEAGNALALAISEATGNSNPDPEEPKILGLPLPKAQLPGGRGSVPLYGNRLRLAKPDGRGFGLLSPAGTSAASMISAALALCDTQTPCHVAAWGNEDDIPGQYPIPDGARGTMIFEYQRLGTGSAGASMRFDCERFTVKDRSLCMASRQDGAMGLSGVRWKQKTEPEG